MINSKIIRALFLHFQDAEHVKQGAASTKPTTKTTSKTTTKSNCQSMSGALTWVVVCRMLSMSGGELQGPTTAEQHKIHADLCCVSQKIKSLQASEEERMTRELQAIELNIKETQRRVSNRVRTGVWEG